MHESNAYVRKTCIQCTIPVFGTAVVKLLKLTTEHTYAFMFPPEDWCWHEAQEQYMCHGHADFV